MWVDGASVSLVGEDLVGAHVRLGGSRGRRQRASLGSHGHQHNGYDDNGYTAANEGTVVGYNPDKQVRLSSLLVDL